MGTKQKIVHIPKEFGTKQKIVHIPKEFAEKIHDDFKGQNLKIHIFDDIPQEYIDFKLVHSEVAAKSASRTN